MQSSAVVIDPIVYILCHAKYRRAIKKLLYGASGEKFSIFNTDGEIGSINAINKSQRITTLTENESSHKRNIFKLNFKADAVSLNRRSNTVLS